MPIQENISLKPYNSFAIDVRAKLFSSFHNVGELSELVNQPGRPKLLVLGGGSNILFTKDFEGLVLKNEIRGIEKVKEDEEYVYLKAGAGKTGTSLYCIASRIIGVVWRTSP